jgi:hypothetical protein
MEKHARLLELWNCLPLEYGDKGEETKVLR